MKFSEMTVSQEFKEMKSRDYITVDCDNDCGSEITLMVKDANRDVRLGRNEKFCCGECKSLKSGGKIRTNCHTCSDEIIVLKGGYGERNFCSKQCYGKYLSVHQTGKSKKEIGMCANCKEPTKNQKFCSVSCSSTHQEKIRVKRDEKGYVASVTTLKQCVNCDEEFYGRDDRRFCSIGCSANLRKSKTVAKWLNGEIPGHSGKAMSVKKFVRRYMHETHGTACSKCGWDEKHPCDGSTLTEIDHIDGDASNTTPDNLRILCPNCHSMTPTFRARNKDGKRER